MNHRTWTRAHRQGRRIESVSFYGCNRTYILPLIAYSLFLASYNINDIFYEEEVYGQSIQL